MNADEKTRVRISEIMGLGNDWFLMKAGYYYRPNAHGYTSNPEEAWRCTEEEAKRHEYPYGEPVTKHKAPPPDYTGDLNAAFQAVEWLREKGWTPVLIAESYDSVWEVTLRKDGHMDVYAVNESLPRAICSAFLACFPNEEGK